MGLDKIIRTKMSQTKKNKQAKPFTKNATDCQNCNQLKRVKKKTEIQVDLSK